MHATEDVRITSIKEVITPEALHRELPLTEQAARTTFHTRQAIRQILAGHDDRLLVIMGPCSIHDPEAAMDYAGKLQLMRERYRDRLLVVMRVYFEKPRTTVGWKGLINDPDLDGSYHINKGIRLARKLLLDLNEAGMPAGTEMLDLITPQYLMDLVGWGAIGARTTESQVHREMASGLSCPVGFKNGTEGNLKIAVDAIGAARHPHVFLSMTMAAHSAIYATAGNRDTHLILRGGKEPNYDAAHVAMASDALKGAGLEPCVMIDFSHANSRKQPERQRAVCGDVCTQIAGGDQRIIGIMAESHLKAGRQDVTPGQALTYGQSITDACMGWEDSQTVLAELAQAVERRREATARTAS